MMVQFDDRQLCSYHEIERRTEEEETACWFTPPELYEIKVLYTYTILLMDMGKEQSAKKAEYTTVGLENLTQSGKQQRHKHKQE